MICLTDPHRCTNRSLVWYIPYHSDVLTHGMMRHNNKLVCMYRSSIGSICTTHIGRYVVVWQTLVLSKVCRTRLYHPVRAVCTGPTDQRYADRTVPYRYCSDTVAHCSDTVAHCSYTVAGCTARYTCVYRSVHRTVPVPSPGRNTGTVRYGEPWFLQSQFPIRHESAYWRITSNTTWFTK